MRRLCIQVGPLKGAHDDTREQLNELQNYTSYGSSSTSSALLVYLGSTTTNAGSMGGRGGGGGLFAKSDRLKLTVDDSF